jgi:hypothetical protein
MQNSLGIDSVVGGEGKMYEGDLALDFHARYFTDRELVPHEKHIPFDQLVDPAHILEDLRGAGFIHSADNHVEYCVRRNKEDGTVEYDFNSPLFCYTY